MLQTQFGSQRESKHTVQTTKHLLRVLFGLHGTVSGFWFGNIDNLKNLNDSTTFS